MPASSKTFLPKPDVVISPTPSGVCDKDRQSPTDEPVILPFTVQSSNCQRFKVFLNAFVPTFFVSMISVFPIFSQIPICPFQFLSATATQCRAALKVLLLVIIGSTFRTSTSKISSSSANNICRSSRSLTWSEVDECSSIS